MGCRTRSDPTASQSVDRRDLAPPEAQEVALMSPRLPAVRDRLVASQVRHVIRIAEPPLQLLRPDRLPELILEREKLPELLHPSPPVFHGMRRIQAEDLDKFVALVAAARHCDAVDV